MKNHLTYILIFAIIFILPLTSCSKPEPAKTDEEIIEEFSGESEIIIPDEPVEQITPQEEESMEIGENEEGSF